MSETKRGQQIDDTHYAVEIHDSQNLNRKTLFYQRFQIPPAVRRNVAQYRFTGRQWWEGEHRFAEVELAFRLTKPTR